MNVFRPVVKTLYYESLLVPLKKIIQLHYNAFRMHNNTFYNTLESIILQTIMHYIAISLREKMSMYVVQAQFISLK